MMRGWERTASYMVGAAGVNYLCSIISEHIGIVDLSRPPGIYIGEPGLVVPNCMKDDQNEAHPVNVI